MDSGLQSQYPHENSANGGKEDIYPIRNENNQKEYFRLSELQFVVRSLYGCNVIAPIDPNPQLILDAGTGSEGIWASEVAEQYRSAHIIGIDKSRCQPLDGPANLTFRSGDLRTDLNQFGDDSFDLVHSRCVRLGIRADEWSAYFKELYRITKPGTGWIQCAETTSPQWEHDVAPNNSYAEFRRLTAQDFASKGIFDDAHNLENYVQAAGFVDTQVFERTMDIGDWRGEAGLAQARNTALSVFTSTIPVLVDRLKGMFPDDNTRNAYAERVYAESQDVETCHMYSTIYMVIGRKPMAAGY